MSDWRIERQQRADGNFWILAEVRAPYYTIGSRKLVMQRFTLYWTGTAWVDHAQYDRRKQFPPGEVDEACADPQLELRLRDYLEEFFGPDAVPS